MAKFLLYEKAAAAAERYLHRDGEREFVKGVNLAVAGAVKEIAQIEDGAVLQFSAAVMGTQLYTATVFYSRNWEGECTCPVEIDCKHCRALVYRLLQLARSKPAAPAKPAAKKTAKPAARPAVKKSRFAVEVEQKLERKMTKGEAGLVKSIEDVYDAHRESKEVPEALIAALWGAQHWSWKSYPVWPEPPGSAWEAWLYLLHFMREQGKAPPEFLAAVTTPDELEALIAPWRWQKSVKSWSAELQRAARGKDRLDERKIDLRVVFRPDGAWLETKQGEGEWAAMGQPRYEAMLRNFGVTTDLTPEAFSVWAAFRQNEGGHPRLNYGDPRSQRALGALLGNRLLASCVLTAAGEPFRRVDRPLTWHSRAAETEQGHYRFELATADGEPLPPPVAIYDGEPGFYVTEEAIYPVTPLGRLPIARTIAAQIPAPAMESAAGVGLLEAAGVPLPERLATRVVRQRAKLVVEASIERDAYAYEEVLNVRLLGEWGGGERREHFGPDGWKALWEGKQAAPADDGRIVTFDRAGLAAAPAILAGMKLAWHHEEHWTRRVTRKFPEEFAAWLLTFPEDVELRLDPLLVPFGAAPLKAGVRLDVEPAGVDWFDLKVALDLPEIEFTPEELAALLNAKGGWVRLGAKGWQRLAVQLSGEEDAALADLGLSPRDLTGGEPQRLHALQISQAGANRLLPPDRVEELRSRASEVKARVSPPVPSAITAKLRPYQVEGFHFLAYLTANRFGGLLADDMGLGKTLQTLTWLTWLREQNETKLAPSLVVCPKSVMDNWGAESARFAPHLRVKMWMRGTTGTIAAAAREHDLLVLNYAQLRIMEADLTKVEWLAVIMDEAQSIKNPDSQTNRAACALRAEHRLALSGTPIENRLLDLWSIMAFTMPGVLGPRARFARTYDQKDDPLARRRLAARTRPFVIRRTKEQVARDLPARVEEELLCEMEGRQATLYRAELKRARQELLKIKTAKELDNQRFHILTSLLRLRQICCHPGLVEAEAMDQPSAKLEALLDLLEPLMEEGRKVLLFSQFVGVLEILQRAIAEKGWPQFILTGQTEDRGDLIARFQATEGPAVFLLSLKASGFGLNLTAASYVVLYDPWWNPAVENQAIDRTHRIGQKSTVFAYRLLVKGSIEEKIRALQKLKSALAENILGEESFARALTLADLKALLAE